MRTAPAPKTRAYVSCTWSSDPPASAGVDPGLPSRVASSTPLSRSTLLASVFSLALAAVAVAVAGCAGGSAGAQDSPDANVTGTGGGVAIGTGGAGTGGAGTGGTMTGRRGHGRYDDGAATGGTTTGAATDGGAATGGAATGGARTGGTGAGGSAVGGGPGRSPAMPGADAGVDSGADATNRPDATFPTSAGKPTVYLAGDSTVSTYAPNAADQQGWGQRLQEFFTTDVVVVNRAIGGRSSKSFVDEGHLAEILAVIKPGDYLFAQWGINDRSVAGPLRATDPATTFRTYLRQYIDGARAKNAIPVLVTPTPRHQFTNGVFQNGFPEYCTAIKAVGAETNTPVIDLQTKGLAYYTSIGDAMVTSVISLDALHFKAAGALQMARLVAQGVMEINVPISQFVVTSKL